MNGNFPSSSKSPRIPPFRFNTEVVDDDEEGSEMILLETTHRPPPPPPAPPSTPVIKAHYQSQAVSQKHHKSLLQQLPQMLADGVRPARPEEYMWLDPSGRPTSPPRPTTPQNKAQSSRKVSRIAWR